MSRSKFFIIFILIFAFAAFMQCLYIVNWDAVWLTHCANILLQGGHYYTDFFETNPPLILWLSFPVVFLMKFFSLPFALKSYVFLFSLLMLLVVNGVLKPICRNDCFDRRLILLILAVVYWVLPVYSFAEREHFALMLTVPYLFLMVLRLRGDEFLLSRWFVLLVAILTAAGLCLKPYFLPVIVFVELYYMIVKRSVRVAVRFETVIIFLCMVLYLMAIYYCSPLYFQKILPIVKAVYMGVYSIWPVSKLISFWGYSLALVAMLCLWGFVFFEKQKHLYIVMLLASFGYYLGFLSQGQVWYYHFYPVMGLLFFLLLYNVFTNFKTLFCVQSRLMTHWGNILRITVCLLLLIWGSLFLLNCAVVGVHMKQNPESRENQVTRYVRQHIGAERVLVISSSLASQQIVRVYTHAQVVSRFPMVLFVPGIERYRLKGETEKYHQLYQQLMQLYMTDIGKYKPRFILVSKTKFWLIRDHKIHWIEVLPFLLRDKVFAKFFHCFKKTVSNESFTAYQKRRRCL